MKCVILTPSYLPTLNGMAYAADLHAQLLISLGVNTHIICPNVHGEPSNSVSNSGAFVHRFNVGGSGLFWNKIWGDLQGVEDKIVELGADLVIAEGWYTWGSYLLGRMPKGDRKFFLASHGSSPVKKSIKPSDIIKWFGYTLYDQKTQLSIIRKLDGALLLSTHQDNERFSDGVLLKKHSIPVFVCSNSSIFLKNDEQPRSLNSPYTLTVIGEMSENKNQLLAVDLLGELLNLHHVRLQLVYPMENSYSAQVRSTVEQKNMSDHVTYLVGKHRNQLKEAISRSALILVVSNTEAQPIVVIDGLALGVPFVSTNVGCLSSMGGGLTGSTDELISIVDRIFCDPAGYLQLSTDALEYYKDHCSVEVARRVIGEMLATT
jgi:glycosyltransferase involved in cell wall biosynthesis